MERDAESPVSSLQSDDGLESCTEKRDRASISPGQIISGRYKIISSLGSGGMSVVYKASHLTLNRPVALKILNRHFIPGSSATERFQREALTVSTLDHPNIVKIFGVGKIGEAPFMAMELLEGESLADLLKRQGRLSQEQALPIFCQLLDALKHAHEKSIVHRDLKPSNVFLCENAKAVKLLDFGIAKLGGDTGSGAQKLTATGEIFGTLTYMSPEQCSGAQVDYRSDLYSMGCLIYEVLDGQPPFRGDTAYSIMAQHTNGHAGSSAFIDESVREVILWAMEKDPSDRPQSAAELKRVLLEPALLARKEKAPHNGRNRLLPTICVIAIGALLTCFIVLKTTHKDPVLTTKKVSAKSTTKVSITASLLHAAEKANDSVAFSTEELKSSIAELDQLATSRKCSRVQKYAATFIKYLIEKRMNTSNTQLLNTLTACLPMTFTKDGKPTKETGLIQLYQARTLNSDGQGVQAFQTAQKCVETLKQKPVTMEGIPDYLRLVKSNSSIRDPYMLLAEIDGRRGEYEDALKYADLAYENSISNPYWRFDATRIKLGILLKMKKNTEVENLLRSEMSAAERYVNLPSSSQHDIRHGIRSFALIGQWALEQGILPIARSAFERERDIATEIGGFEDLHREAVDSLTKLDKYPKTAKAETIHLTASN